MVCSRYIQWETERHIRERTGVRKEFNRGRGGGNGDGGWGRGHEIWEVHLYGRNVSERHLCLAYINWEAKQRFFDLCLVMWLLRMCAAYIPFSFTIIQLRYDTPPWTLVIDSKRKFTVLYWSSHTSTCMICSLIHFFSTLEVPWRQSLVVAVVF